MTVKGLHLELTNKCTLKCPRCARTTFIDKFGISKWANSDLNLDDLKQFLDIDLHGVEVMLSGTYGDPIYYNNIFELVEWLKKQGATIRLITNGSYKTAAWWDQLTTLFDSTDIIVFSIDGIPDNFTNYRVNANWPSIEIGIKSAVASKVKTRWKYIPFSFNEHTIDQARELSRQLGMDEFVVAPSDRWEDNDYLRPTKDTYQGQRDNAIVQWKSADNRTSEISPKCHENNQHYISADGFYMPCCFVSDWRFFYKTKFYKNKETYNISKTTISQLLAQEQEFFQSIKSVKPAYCTFNCPTI